MNHADVIEALRDYAALTPNPAQTEEVVAKLIQRAKLEVIVEVLRLASKHHITDGSTDSVGHFLDALEQLP